MIFWSLDADHEIGHCYLAVRTGLHRLKEFFGDDRLCIALALVRKFVQIHRIGDVDGDHEFDIDGRRIVYAVSLLRLWTRSGACDAAPRHTEPSVLRTTCRFSTSRRTSNGPDFGA